MAKISPGISLAIKEKMNVSNNVEELVFMDKDRK